MALERRTLTVIRDQAQTELNRIPGVDSRIRRSVLNVLSRMVAAVVWGLEGMIVFASTQIFADTATGTYLRRIAAIWGVDAVAATFASGEVDLTGNDGSIIPSGTLLARQDGVQYSTIAEATIAAGVAVVSVQASLGGEIANAVAGTALNFLSPVSGVDSAAAVAVGGLTGGADEESDLKLRTRLLQAIRKPAAGGSVSDYERWALEALVSVSRVFPSSPGPGQVDVLFVEDDEFDGPIPDAAAIAIVQAYINDPSRKPITADVTVGAPAALTVDFTITLNPDTAAIRLAVEANLKDLLRREGEPGATVPRSPLREAISGSAGEFDHTLTVPAGDVVVGATEIAVLGTITWV